MTSLLNKIIFTAFLLLQLVAIGQNVDKEGIPEKPNPPRLVNDFAGILSNNNLQNLEDKLVAYDDSTSTQISIVTVKSIDDYSIEDFSVRLGRKWGVGQKDKNNGILIVVAKEERKVDIEIGYGLEEHITDYDSKHIIDELIIPAFKQSNYYEGLDAATDRIIEQLQGTFTNNGSNNEFIPTWVIIVIVIFFIFFIISLFPGSHNNIGSNRGGGWTWSSGGGSSWGGSSSGGFGGFGGGSFGGGGSSGSW